MAFDTETWENIIVLGVGLLIAAIYLWNTIEVRALRKAVERDTSERRTLAVALDTDKPVERPSCKGEVGAAVLDLCNPHEHWEHENDRMK